MKIVTEYQATRQDTATSVGTQIDNSTLKPSKNQAVKPPIKKSDRSENAIAVVAEAPATDSTAGLKAAYPDPLLKHLPAPGNFTEKERLDLAASGISIEAATRNKMTHVSAKEAERLTRQKYAGLLIPYHDKKGNLIAARSGVCAGLPYCRLKLETPIQSKDGKTIKYLAAKGSGVEIYLPVEPVWPVDSKFNQSRKQRREWAKIIHLTEGEKGALSLSEQGYPCVGLGGVDSFLLKEGEGKNETKTLHPTLADLFFGKNHPEVRLCFDSDAAQKKEVASAHKRFTGYFLDYAASQSPKHANTEERKAAARLKFFVLAAELADTERVVIGDRADNPKNLKNGVDDWIMRHGVKSLINISNCALPLAAYKKGNSEEEGGGFVCVYSATPWIPKGRKAAAPEAKTMRSLLIATISGRFLARKDKTYKWFNGEIWEAANDDRVDSLALAVPSENGWADRFATTPTREAQAAINYTLKTKRIDWNPGNLLAFKNGVLNLETNKLLSFSHTLAITQQLGFNYNPKATAGKFLKFLSQALGSDEQIDLAKAFIRIALEPKARFKNRKYDYGFIMYLLGDPGTGKGTFCQLVMDLLGASAEGFDAASLGDPSGVSPSLMDKNLIIDLDHKGGFGRTAIGRMNKIASNEPAPINHLYVNRYNARLNTVIALVANEAPQLSGNDRGGFGRRCKYLRFQAHNGPANENLLNELQSELAGIYNWAMAIKFDEAIATIKNYKMEAAAALEMAESSDSFMACLIEMVEQYGDSPTPLSDLMDYQNLWCKQSNAKPFGKQKLKAKLIAAGATETRDGPNRNRVLSLPATVEAINISGATGIPTAPPPTPKPKEEAAPPPPPAEPAAKIPTAKQAAQKAVTEKMDWQGITTYLSQFEPLPDLYLSYVIAAISNISAEEYTRIAATRPDS